MKLLYHLRGAVSAMKNMMENFYMMSLLHLLNMLDGTLNSKIQHSEYSMINKNEMDVAILHLLNVPPIDELPHNMQIIAEVFRKDKTSKDEAVAYMNQCCIADVEYWILMNRELNLEGSFAI